MRSIVLVLSAAAAACVTVQFPALADDYRGSTEQQMACTPDVWRLCSDQIPDTDRIVACLRQNTARLSDGCRAAFKSHNSAARPRRGRRPAYGDSGEPQSPDNGWFR